MSEYTDNQFNIQWHENQAHNSLKQARKAGNEGWRSAHANVAQTHLLMAAYLRAAEMEEDEL